MRRHLLSDVDSSSVPVLYIMLDGDNGTGDHKYRFDLSHVPVRVLSQERHSNYVCTTLQGRFSALNKALLHEFKLWVFTPGASTCW